MGIQYLTYQQINIQKWNDCVNKADNGLIYAYSYYLDAMALNWDALILNDYEAIMPLTWKKKFGIHYLYQPHFMACLGVFGKNISAQLVNDFLNTIPRRFMYWDIYLNRGNFFSLEDFQLYERMNYVLSLKNNYDNLFEGFRDNIKRNIKKAQQLNCIVKKNFPVEEVIALAKERSKSFSKITNGDFEHFRNLYQHLSLSQKAITYGIFSPTNDLVASCVFFFSHNRAYYIFYIALHKA